MGKVFRRQDENPERPNEYVQVGYEVFDRENPAAADAEVFALIAEALGDAPVHPVTGDIGILMQAVNGLQTTERRKAALMRHIWRPTRFRELLARFAGETEVPPSRAHLLAQADPFAEAGPQIGLRARSEVAARIEALKEDAVSAPISKEEVALIAAILDIRAGAQEAHVALVDLAKTYGAIAPAVAGLGARLDAMQTRGIDVATLAFEGGYGRTSMEYYDGFVFGFYADGALNLPAIASGGRYDALTARLGHGAAIPAVGAVIRPEFLLMTKGAA
jgi:ATP phosphoribosyltransferase regulatory subunit